MVVQPPTKISLWKHLGSFRPLSSHLAGASSANPGWRCYRLSLAPWRKQKPRPQQSKCEISGSQVKDPKAKEVPSLGACFAHVISQYVVLAMTITKASSQLAICSALKWHRQSQTIASTSPMAEQIRLVVCRRLQGLREGVNAWHLAPPLARRTTIATQTSVWAEISGPRSRPDHPVRLQCLRGCLF